MQNGNTEVWDATSAKYPKGLVVKIPMFRNRGLKEATFLKMTEKLPYTAKLADSFELGFKYALVIKKVENG